MTTPPEESMLERAADRVTFEGDSLDEVFASRGAHLERMDKNRWFLIFYHDDGTQSAFWFSSRDLKKPFWEKRPAPERIARC